MICAQLLGRGRRSMELEVKDLCKSFGQKEVLKGLSFKTEGGKTFGLLGRNGAGKTTALRILMGVFPADGGSITLDGAPIDRSAVKIGYLPEERGLYARKKIFDQLVYFAKLKGLGGREAASSVEFWLKRLGMESFGDRRLDTLSKGNQQKIQLITALCHDPQIIILDEPFSGLDPVNAAIFKDVIGEQISKGKAVIFSGHQMGYIEEFCDSIAIINGGREVLYGDLREIKRNYTRDKLFVNCVNPGPVRQAFGQSCFPAGKNGLMIKLQSPDQKQAVMKRLVEEFDVDEVKVFEPSLGDIFVEYAGGSV